MKYLVLPHLAANQANALQTWWLIAPPSPMTLHGFSRALGRHLGVRFERLAILHHGMEVVGTLGSGFRNVPAPKDRDEEEKFGVRTHILLPAQMRCATYIDDKDRASGGFTVSLQPTVRAQVEVSLILGFEAGAIDSDFVRDLLPQMRIGGSPITDYWDPRVILDLDHKIGGGFFVIDRSDLVHKTMAETGLDGTEALFRTLWHNTNQTLESDDAVESVEPADEPENPTAVNAEIPATDEDKPAPEKPVWLGANTIGYTALEDPRQRAGSRDDLQHAYAEPLVGLIEYRSVRRTDGVPMWAWHTDTKRQIYQVRGIA